ncbi:MAG: aminotransferase class I/II-fold pyridoxal phosphate-dependent enzyme [Candidatus Bathyarchaeota archaeon]
MNQEIDHLRGKIREVDERVLKLIKHRLDLAQKIGNLKKSHHLPITDTSVEKQVIDHALSVCKTLGLDERLAERLINLLMAESVKIQGKSIAGRSSYLYEIFEMAEELESKGAKIVRMDAGEPDFTLSDPVKNIAKSAIDTKGLTSYVSSRGLSDLREAIADNLNADFGVDIQPNQVLITPGGKYAVFAGILASLSPLDRAVVPAPCWPVYEECVMLANGRTDYIHTTLEDEWAIDTQKIKDAFDAGAKLLILNNPCNPTGKIMSEENLREIVSLAAQKNVLILSDEVYSAYAFKNFKSILQVHDNKFICTNSFSKKFGMTGWRIGYVVADSETISKIHKILQVSVTCVPGFIQKAALAALKSAEKNILKKEIKNRVEHACKELNRLPISYFKPEGAMYIFPEVKIKNFNSHDFAKKLLIKERVAVSPGVAFGNYPGYIRLAVTTSLANIDEGIKRMGNLIKSSS